MAKNRLPSLFYPLFLALLALRCRSIDGGLPDEKKVYVVYMGELPKGGVSTSSLHHSLLERVLGSGNAAKESLLYSYGRSFNGFVAKLSDEEVERFSEMEGVVSVLPNTHFQLHTTRSWDFMGLPETQIPSFPQETDLVVGLIDTGVWPESESFNDEGFGPPPKTWKGICQTENNFTCNNKVIGARFYNIYDYYGITDIKSPRDSEGHGSHTASIAAGRSVPGASYYGLAEGTARGGVPQARIAVYKACWSFGCVLADVLAAFDDAIADGVDIISVSLGYIFPLDYFEDPIAIGAFHAMKNGILTAMSAGNHGFRSTAVNVAPWAVTVAASSIDRKFVSQLVLGNGKVIPGNAINSIVLNDTKYPLIYGGDAANISAGISRDDSRYCLPDTLNSDKVQGKIVYCETIYDALAIKTSNALGAIMSDDRFADYAIAYVVTATLIQPDDGDKVLQYIQTNSNPIGTILKTETWNDVVAPKVVSFSSKGPNQITPDILKPDLTAPGADILAAWSPIAPYTMHNLDTRPIDYNILSGTSMSCPHVSGAATYVKSAHPTWSPSAIKSALMTTASIMDPRKHDEGEFAYGSGHINPAKAVDPGLVFDASVKDYINFLCNQGYNTTLLRAVTGDSSTCSGKGNGKAWSLNYPSLALSIQDGQPIRGYFPRTVTNVGFPNSTYHATVNTPPSLKVTVQPSVLSFTSIGEKKTFLVKVRGEAITQVPLISGSIVWSDGVHVVRSPLVVYTVLSSSPQMSVNRTHSLGVPSLYLKKGMHGGRY